MVVSRVFDRISVEEYLEAEQYSEVRHEYLYGDVYAVPDSSITHSLITGNILFTLHQAADKTKYRVYQNAMLLRAKDEVFYYPDVMIASGEIVNDHYEVNPCIIVETMSEMTARQDNMEKRHIYLSLECLKLYLSVDSRKRWVKSYRRIENKWQETTRQKDDVIDIPCLGTTLTLKQIYNTIKLT